jgi:hypothetical protein
MTSSAPPIPDPEVLAIELEADEDHVRLADI